MGHPRNRFTDRAIRNLPPGMHADGQGLYVVVDESGARRWILRTMVQGRRPEIGLGGFPTVGLAQAREDAHRYRSIAKKGGNPIAERDNKINIPPPFSEVAKAVHEAHAPSWRNEKHAAQWLSTLTEYVFPIFGDKRVDAVNSADVLKAMSPIWLTKPETARRVLQRIGTVMKVAKAKLYRTDNPIDGVREALPKQNDQDVHHAALPYADIPEFLIKLRAAGASGPIKLALEFLILTATRTSEVLLAQRSEIEGDVWVIPAERMKARREHRVPLSGRCIEIVKCALELADDSPYLFASGRNKKPLSNMVFLMLLRRMNVPATAHGFRSTFRDWTAEKTNFSREVCEAALAHTVGNTVEAAYRRTDLFEKRKELMATWAAFVAHTSGNVVPIRTAA